MGLLISHNCWNASYSSFAKFRRKLCLVAGMGNLADYDGFAGDQEFTEDDICILLNHSDCYGTISPQDALLLAERMETLHGHMEVHGWGEQSQRFIDGLRQAHDQQQTVEFF